MSHLTLDPACIRKTANWTTISKQHKFDKQTFDEKQTLDDIAKSSPKLKALLENIKELDAKDIAEQGKNFKHFIFSEVKQGGYGVKIITSGLIASGYKLAYDNKLKLLSDSKLLETKGHNFLLLASTDVFGNSITAKKKKELLDKYNQRPDNPNGDLVRIILLDSGYKEGIDLFDVKYVHIFEPQTSKADLKQAIGRATRMCGQRGLEFHPSRGWPLRVYLYDISIPQELQEKYGSETLFKSYLMNSGIDLKLLEFVEELEKYSIIGAIDYELTKNIHRFEIEDDEFFVPLYKLLQEGGEIFCRKKCGKLRPTKNVPVSIPLFVTVLMAQGKVVPDLGGQRVREYFCSLLKKNKEFCSSVQEAWSDPVDYVKKNENAIAASIKQSKHSNLPNYNKRMFVRFYKSIIKPKEPKVKNALPSNNEPYELTTVQDISVKPNSIKSSTEFTEPPTSSMQGTTSQSSTVQGKQASIQEKSLQSSTVQGKQTSIQEKSLQSSTVQGKQASIQEKSLQSSTVQGKQNVVTKTPMPTPQPFLQKPITIETPKQVKPFEPTPLKEEETTLPSPDKVMSFLEMRNFIRDNYIQFTWPKVTLENLCIPKGGTPQIMSFTPTQDLIRQIFTPSSAYKGMLLWHSVGTGKCHAKNTPILMYDGSIKLVQDIEVGDQVMGDDSTPRTVITLGRGNDVMYRIDQDHGDSYTVNSEHILCLQDPTGYIHEIEVRDYLNLSDDLKQVLKGYKMPVEFDKESLVFDAYDIGVEFYNRRIPKQYLINTTNVRLQVLAGIIDTIGSFDKNVYTLTSTSKDITFLARSLGFSAQIINSVMHITGKGIENIPVRNPNLRASLCTTEVLSYAINVTKVGKDAYYGFTLDGNNRYLLGDFTVTHNTCCAIATATSSFEKLGYTIIWVTRTTLKSDIWKNMYDQICSLVIKDRVEKGEKIPAEFARRMRMLSKSWKIKPMSYKQFSNLVSGKNQLYKDLVAINGAQDPLRKTLLIIDEAHKLYGGADLAAIERPNMPKLQAAIADSYKKSGKDSVKVLLMTGTPITNDAMELVKLINLVREEQLPTKYDEFAKEFLDENGKFTKRGSRKYLDAIAGSISYLSREKDARQFSQPTIIPMNVPLGKSEYGADMIEKYEQQYNETSEKNNEEIASLKGKISQIKQDRMEMKRKIKSGCQGMKKEERAECLKNAEYEISYLDKHFDEELDEHSTKINQLTSYTKDLKTELAVKKKLAKEDTSQQAIIETKCVKASKKKKATKNT